MDSSPLALVTGASSGMGKDITIKLAQKGYQVLAAARRLDRLEQMAEELDGVIPTLLDLTDRAQMGAFCQRIKQMDKPISLLVNNAGYSVRGMVEEVPLDAARRMYEVNVFAPCRLVQACMPGMRAARAGWIINISSISGKFVWPGNGYYASSKHALEGITDALRHEAAPFGIKVVSIRPGPVKTEFGQVVAAESSAWAGKGDPDYAPVADKIAAFFARATQADHVPGPEIVGDLLLRILQEDNPLPAYELGPMVEDYFAKRCPGDEAEWRDFIDKAVGLKDMKL